MGKLLLLIKLDSDIFLEYNMSKIEYSNIQLRLEGKKINNELINILKALAHENRLRLLNLLSEQELCVCEVRNIMDITQSNASRHLAKLRNVNLVNSERKEQWVYYSINSSIFETYPFLQQLIEKEIIELEICQKDKKSLLEYNKSNLSCEVLDDSDLFNDD